MASRSSCSHKLRSWGNQSQTTYTDDQQDCIYSNGQRRDRWKWRGNGKKFLGFCWNFYSQVWFFLMLNCISFVSVKYPCFFIIKHPYTILNGISIPSTQISNLLDMLPQYNSRLFGMILFKEWFLKRSATTNNFLVGRENHLQLAKSRETTVPVRRLPGEPLPKETGST